MMYFCGIDNLTELQARRIMLLQSYPVDAACINGEFMKMKDKIIHKRDSTCTEPKMRLPRITYKVKIISDTSTYVELRDNIICVSLPAYQAFNAEYLDKRIELPNVNTPNTMAFFLPPLTDIPVYTFN